MTGRPTAAPGLLAELAAAVPPRLVKRLDAEPRLADAWTWTFAPDGATTVATGAGEVVTLRPEGGEVRSGDQVSCTCLLAPRCLHRLAVAASLDVSDAAADGGDPAREAAGPAPADAAPLRVAVGDERREAARQAWAAACDLLERGALSAGTAAQAELLRAVHSCRAAGLHRLASAGLRVARAARDLRSGALEASADDLAADLLDLLGTAWALGGARPAAEAVLAPDDRVGVARRAYEPLGNLRLHGLFTEPVVSATGYAGVVTWLCDAQGRAWSLPDVVPAGPGRARSAYGAAAGLGDVSLTHRALGREGLFVEGATGSRDRRLGSGSGVRAARAGPSSWSDEPIASLFRAPLGAQLDRAWGALAVPSTDRPGGDELLYLRGRVAGADRESLWLEVAAEGDAVAVRAAAPSDHADLPWRDNLRTLARCPGLELAMVGRLDPRRSRALSLLAVGAPAGSPGGPDLRLPPEWGGRVNLGLDRLQGGHLPEARGVAVTVEDPDGGPADPLEPLRRRVRRAALGGRATLPPEAGPEVGRETAALGRRLMPGAAELLAALATEATRAPRGPRGERLRGDPEALARAWLAAAAYEDAATRALGRASWN